MYSAKLVLQFWSEDGRWHNLLEMLFSYFSSFLVSDVSKLLLSYLCLPIEEKNNDCDRRLPNPNQLNVSVCCSPPSFISSQHPLLFDQESLTRSPPTELGTFKRHRQSFTWIRDIYNSIIELLWCLESFYATIFTYLAHRHLMK